MKIVHVITRFIHGGADENALQIANAQASQGHEVSFVFGRDAEPEKIAALDPRIRWYREPWLTRNIHPLKDPLAIGRLWRLFRRLHPDVVHTHNSKAGVVGRVAATWARVPVVAHAVTIINFERVRGFSRWLILTIEKSCVRCTGVFLPLGEAIQEAYLREGIGRAEDHVLVPSVLDVDRFRNAVRVGWRSLIPAQAVALPDPQFVILISAFERRKRQAPFLQVFATVARRVPRAVLLLLGKGPDEEHLRGEVRRLGLEGRVVFCGFQPNIEQYLALADASVLASEREGLPKVVQQSVLAGVPMVTTDLPGIRRIIHHGENGYCVALDRLDLMEDPLVAILSDPELRSRFSTRSRQVDFSATRIENVVRAAEHGYAVALRKRQPQDRAPAATNG